LAVVWATKHFRTYLYGHPCDVFTDHEALQALLNSPHSSGKLASPARDGPIFTLQTWKNQPKC